METHKLWIGTPNLTTNSGSGLEMGKRTAGIAPFTAAQNWLRALIDTSR